MADKQTPIGRGRGRGKGRGTPPAVPNKETIESLKDENASQAAQAQQSSEQFANAPSLNELPVTPPPHNSSNPGPSTTIGEGKTPPLVEAIKGSLQKGVIVANSISNPQMLKFSPSVKTPFPFSNGPSSDPSTSNNVSRLPIMNKMQLPSLSTRPGLNVTASEFVPSFSVETVYENGLEGLSIEESPDNILSIDEILSGFEPVSYVGDLSAQPIMRDAAEMLVKGTLYVGSFNQFKEKVLKTLSHFTPSPSVFENLAEMLVYWGVVEPYLCYTSCKMCEFIFNEGNEFTRAFRNALITRIKAWYIKETKAVSDEHYRIINFSLFFSELFSRLTIGEEPIEILADNVFSLVNKLLSIKSSDTVIGACNILKLTGFLLEGRKNIRGREKMDEVISRLKDLFTESALSKSCTELLARVIEQHTRRWGHNGSVSAINVQSSLQLDSPSVKETKGKLNVSAPPFIPASFQYQQPVTNADEWNDFATEYEPEAPEPVSVLGVDYDCPDGDDGLDPDIELEMEAFIDEIEEHLLMQDFDPDLQHM